MRGREKERERRGKELEKKAREQADQCECLTGSGCPSLPPSISPFISQFQFEGLYWHGKHMLTLPKQAK
jgi:hypothetical protein